MIHQAASLASLPVWPASLIVVGLAIASAIITELILRRIIPHDLRREHNSMSAAVFTVTGTTYAVLLAFVAMLAWEGYNHAQAITDEEASLVQNVYQLVDGLTGPEMAGMRADIMAYADVVRRTEWPAQETGRDISEAEVHLDHLTTVALHLRPDNIADGNLHTLLLSDLTRLGSARRERLFAARTPIPVILWVVLLCGGGITVVLASFLGSSSLTMHLAMSSLLAVSGALVLLVILALSNPYRGDLRVSPLPFEQVLQHMAAH
jgi:hypothetical protein